MQRSIVAIVFLLLLVGGVCAQTSTSSNLIAYPIPDRSVFFSISDSGEYKPIIWGLDLAWLSEANIRHGMAFMGSDHVDLVRSLFTPTAPLVNGELQTDELATLNERLHIISMMGENTQVVLNCDHPSVAPWFAGNAANWVQLILYRSASTGRHIQIKLVLLPQEIAI